MLKPKSKHENTYCTKDDRSRFEFKHNLSTLVQQILYTLETVHLRLSTCLKSAFPKKSAVTHLLIFLFSCFTTALDYAADAPPFVFIKLPKNIATPILAPCAQNLDLYLCCTQSHENRARRIDLHPLA